MTIYSIFMSGMELKLIFMTWNTDQGQINHNNRVKESAD